MLITDGIQNSYMLDASGGGVVNTGFTYFSPCAQPTCYAYGGPTGVEQSIGSATCAPVKNLGYTLMTMNTTYLIPPANMQINAFYEGAFGAIQNYLIPQSTANMIACATSPSLAFSGASPQELSSAVQSMFNALTRQTALRLTN
jgi:hypothetical protein